MRLINADRLCEDLLNRWSIADTKKEELIRQVMADVVTPIVVSQPVIDLQKWISCDEGLPKYGQVVLWCNEHGSVFTSAITARCGDSWAIGKKHRSAKVVAWQPLPEPYEKKE